jgi:hypothetical protein
MSERIEFDFSDVDPSKVELLPAGFVDLQKKANASARPIALGGFGWPLERPIVWFVVCAEEGHLLEATHLAVCADEATGRAVCERVGRAFVDAGAARVSRPN